MTANHPDKLKVHEYLARRIEQQHTKEHVPPPSLEEVRRQLGWNLLPDKDRGR